jgi:hypothetical protein
MCLIDDLHTPLHSKEWWLKERSCYHGLPLFLMYVQLIGSRGYSEGRLLSKGIGRKLAATISLV